MLRALSDINTYRGVTPKQVETLEKKLTDRLVPTLSALYAQDFDCSQDLANMEPGLDKSGMECLEMGRAQQKKLFAVKELVDCLVATVEPNHSALALSEAIESAKAADVKLPNLAEVLVGRQIQHYAHQGCSRMRLPRHHRPRKTSVFGSWTKLPALLSPSGPSRRLAATSCACSPSCRT